MTRAARRANPAFRFTPVQDELLQVALAPDSGTALRWATFCRHTSLDDVERRTRRLLPLVERNLERLGAPADLVERTRTRAARRESAHAHAVRMSWLAPLLAQLHSAGIGVVVLKGVALANQYYEDPSLRPMVDVDLLVRSQQVSDTLDALSAAGFTTIHAPSPTTRRRGLELDLRGPAGEKLDLHWHLQPALADAMPTDELFARAVPISLDGTETRTLDPTDTFVHLLVHGAANGWRSHPIWVADAVMLVERGPAFDGDRLVQLVRAAGVGYPVAQALTYLASRFRCIPRFSPGTDAGEVTAEVVRMGSRPSLRQQRLYAQMASGTGPPAWLTRTLGPLDHTYHFWAAQTVTWSRARAAGEAPRWLADHWSLDAPTDLPRAAWAKARARLSRRR